jgi:hypothetical protein
MKNEQKILTGKISILRGFMTFATPNVVSLEGG